MSQQDMVVKRNGTKEIFSFDKILKRVTRLGRGELSINYTSLVQKIIDRLYDGINTSLIDELTAQQCASLTTTHYDYGTLASRILISNHHKNTESNYLKVVEIMYHFKDIHGVPTPLVNEEFYHIIKEHHPYIQTMLDYDRDYLFSYFGFKTLERAYLAKVDGIIVERPQHMWMRVAVAIHGSNLTKVATTYYYLSHKYFTHATPTLFNAGLRRQQLSSCYLLTMCDDSIDGIYETLADCAKISKWSGGIGLSCHNIRAAGSHIRGTNGISNGLVPMLRVYNNTARYVDQGGGRRNGSFAIYLEPWHKDVREFLEMKKNHGDEEQRARDLFYALWIPDLFMERVHGGAKWTLMCPDECPGLNKVYGSAFNKLYESYEKAGKGTVIEARDLWFKILDSQIETGTPYMLYKGACNRKSNQQNLGTIQSSNLCTEIIEYSSKDETAVCNLASLGLPMFLKKKAHNIENVIIYTKTECVYCRMAKALLKNNAIQYEEVLLDETDAREAFYSKMTKKLARKIHSVPQVEIGTGDFLSYMELSVRLTPEFNYKKLHEVTKIVTENLNKIIDINFYPTEKTRRSNYLHRPVGIGIQGLADVLALMKIPFDSEEAKVVNLNIFRTIYHAALERSNEIAKERCEGMEFLKSCYRVWRPKESHEVMGHSRDYRLGYPECEQKEKIKGYLHTHLPIPMEIEKLFGTQRGAYSSFAGSPASKGILQFDMWESDAGNWYEWDVLKASIMKYGLRNSLLVAPMPTASTSQILGNNECFEPYTSNIYVRRVIAGEFIIVNAHLLRELVDIGLWTPELKDSIIAHNGSVQHLDIPTCIRDRYKTVWEIPMRHIIDMAADRGAFIDQSQSMNLWMSNPTYDKLTAMHFHSYRVGLKTGLYYLRTRAKAAPQQFTIDPEKKPNNEPENEICDMCSS